MNTTSATWSDEAPTRPTDPVNTRMVAFAARVERLCTLAAERLSVAPDEDAVASALADVEAIQALAAQVLK